MALAFSTFSLIKKTQLTHDVFELIFQKENSWAASVTPPGQYILFTLPKTAKKRAYSIAYAAGDLYHFVIKRLAHEGAGSAELCDTEIGGTFQAMWPMGHFVLTEGDKPRAFIGTGTGFAPLYFQIRALEDRDFKAKTHFVFGVRHTEDKFYQDELRRISDAHANFTFTQFLSQWVPLEGERNGYVGDILDEAFVANFEEFYLCGSPTMVKWAREKLANLWIPPENIKFEQF